MKDISWACRDLPEVWIWYFNFWDLSSASYWHFIALDHIRLATLPITAYSGSIPLEKKNDRLGASPATNLQTKIGQFVLKGTVIPYNGPYHIHPTLGPMAGAKHVNAQHYQSDYVGTSTEKPSELTSQQNYSSTNSTSVSDLFK